MKIKTILNTFILISSLTVSLHSQSADLFKKIPNTTLEEGSKEQFQYKNDPRIHFYSEIVASAKTISKDDRKAFTPIKIKVENWLSTKEFQKKKRYQNIIEVIDINGSTLKSNGKEWAGPALEVTPQDYVKAAHQAVSKKNYSILKKLKIDTQKYPYALRELWVNWIPEKNGDDVTNPAILAYKHSKIIPNQKRLSFFWGHPEKKYWIKVIDKETKSYAGRFKIKAHGSLSSRGKQHELFESVAIRFYPNSDFNTSLGNDSSRSSFSITM